MFWRTSTFKTLPIRHVLARGYASETNAAKHGGQQQFAEESFNGNIWRNTIIAVIAGVAWFRIDQRITDQGEEKHPFTKWIEYRMTSSDEMDRLNNENMEASGKIAEYRLITQDAQRAPIYRMRYPESFERASPRALSAGTHADLSDLKVRLD